MTLGLEQFVVGDAVAGRGPPIPVSAAGARLRSLDAARGLAIAAMIFVNVPGAVVWPQLQHARWNGLTVADLVFPAFLVVVGGSLAVGRVPGPSRVLRRVVILVGLGLVVNRATFAGPWRYPGVLQRIALCYLLAVVIVRFPRRFVVVVAAALLAAHAVLLRIGGMTASRSFGGTVDIAVFGQRHLYHQYRYDPEGLVGSIAATATVLVGFLAMSWLKSRPATPRTVGLVVCAAAGLGVAGWAAGLVQPVNKRMWSPSFTLVTAGAALLAFALVYELIEVLDWRAVGRPLEVIGANAVAVYVASELGDAGLHRITIGPGRCPHVPCVITDGHDWIFDHWFASWAGVRPGSLLFSLAAVAVLWAVAALMWRAHLFLRA